MLLFNPRVRALAFGAVFSVMPIAAAAQGEQNEEAASQTPPDEAQPPEVESQPQETATPQAPQETATPPEQQETQAPPADSEAGEAQPSVQKEAPLLMSRKSKAVWSLVGVSGAALVTGGIFGLTALDEKQRYDESPDKDSAQDFKDRKDARTVASYVSFGVAGAAAAAALIVWLVVDEKRGSDDDRASVTTDGTSLTIKF